MQTLFAKIDAEPVRRPRASFSIGAWLTDFVTSFRPRTLAYGAMAAALAIVLQAGILAGLVGKGGGTSFHPAARARERQGRFRRGPVHPAGQRRRYHQIPDRQQGFPGWRSGS